MNSPTNTTKKRYRLIFAEDEKPAREKLSHQLSLMENIEVIDYAVNGKQAITMINEHQPEIVLLDIQMPEVNGLELVDLLNYQPVIIYTTAFDQYAIDAFEKSSIDYLLKPYPLARLKKALEKATAQIDQTNLATANNATQQSPTFEQNSQINKLVSKNGERIFILSPDQLMFIKSEQGNSRAWDGTKFHPITDTLDQLENALIDQQFVRIHRSYLVNINHIKEIQRWFNGKLMVIINDNDKTELSTSRAGSDKLKQLLGL